MRFSKNGCFSLVSRPILGVFVSIDSELPSASGFGRFTHELAFLRKWEMNYEGQKN